MADKKIPLLFEEAAIYQPLTPISNNLPNIGKTRVRLFYKYANRNHSYITDRVAEQIIQSAPTKPVIGFFNRETGDYTTHMGESLVSGYGFVSENPNFAWEKHRDKDGIEREYACFDVILHTEYFPEANKIVGQPQSMELNDTTIDGDWGLIDDEYYFIYTNATLKGLCVLGKNVEPCFEGSAFFSYSDKVSNFDKFSALLLDLQTKVKETENFNEGGEPKMNEQEIIETTEQIPAAEEFVEQMSSEEETVVAVEEITNVEAVEAFEETTTEETTVTEVEETVEDSASTEFENLKASFESLQAELLALKADFEALVSEKQAIEQAFSTEKENFANEQSSLKEQLNAANDIIESYKLMEQKIESERKNSLIENYEKMLSAEEVADIKNSMDDFSYEELDSKMAVLFAHKNMPKTAKKVPLLPDEQSGFANFMKNYKK